MRLEDHPPLHHAIERGKSIIPVFIWEVEKKGVWNPGAASRVWLHHSLIQMQKELAAKKSQLIIRRGQALSVLKQLIEETNADSVYWNRRYEPDSIQHDTAIKTALRETGIEVKTFNGSLLYEPWEVKTKSGTPFQVFTRFWEACKLFPEPSKPLPVPKILPPPLQWPHSLDVHELRLLPKVDWTDGIRETWQPGEKGAQTHLQRFISSAIDAYSKDRDFPAVIGTSRLSPHLHAGEISPRQIWYALRESERLHSAAQRSNEIWAYLREIGWREFAHHLLFHFPHTPDKPLRTDFERFPWKNETQNLRAWQKGLTGYPIVDAGMRELWHTGWMHNRVRMIVASFLVKDLLIPWQEGAAWFWDTLVDADLANNTMGWQWSAGCGADAAPFFRIFNPVLQSRKFDANGSYIRRWIPELSELPNKWIHEPWTASADVLTHAGINLGKDYPFPIVDHSFARHRALNALQTLKRKLS